MIFLLFFCIVIVSGGGGYGPPRAQYDSIPYYAYQSYSSEEHRRDIRKLSDLNGTKIFKADVKYFTSKHDDYAVISCKPNPRHDYYTWILIGSETQKFKWISNNLPYTLPLAGGLNVTYLAKYGRDKKWHGKDMFFYESRKFMKVGCHFSEEAESDIDFDG